MPRRMRDFRQDMRRDSRRDMRDSVRDRVRDRLDRGRGYDMASRKYGDREHSRLRSSSNYPQSDYARGDRTFERSRERDRHYEYPMYSNVNYGWGNEPYDYKRRDYRGDYNYDYAESDKYLSDDELMEWSKDLMKEVDSNDKPFFTKDNIEQKAQMHGITFGDDYTFAEFYTTALMEYTDYKDTVGTGNMDMFLLLAKDWLEDDDVDIRGGEKLATYYDEIVCAKD